MAVAATLFDIFGELTPVWPIAVIQRMLGILGPGSSDPDLAVWLAALNNGTSVTGVRTAADGSRASIEARLQFDNAQAAFPGAPEAFPFVVASMPDVEFRIRTIAGADAFVQLFASVSDAGAEVVLEGLPVEIRLPAGLITPHPSPTEHLPGDEAVVGEFTAGRHDSLQVVYRRDAPTSIFVHVRFHVTPDNDITIRPAVPISFGKCLFSEMPCLAVHDFGLIPAPSTARANVEWLRHAVTPWNPDFVGSLDGLFSIRSISIDSTQEPFKGLADKLNESSTKEPDAEFVIDDLVLPFLSPYIIPLPRHITLGIRRRVISPDEQREVFQFERAPVQVFLGADDAWGFIVESLFYKSLPSEDLSEDLGLTFKAAVFFGKEESAQHAFEIGLAENYTPTLGYRRDFSSSTGMPEPGTGAEQTINALLHWEIVTIAVDIMAFRAGYSLGRAIGEGKGFGDCFEFTADLFVNAPPSGSDDSLIFRMRSLDGERVAFAIEGLGWRQGSFHFEGLSIPDGVAIFFLRFTLIVFEVGLSAEDGASYLSFTAGVIFPTIKGVQGAIVVKRLRFNVAGNPDAPRFKLDGFFISLSFGNTTFISAGGFYTDKTIAETRIRELGLTGTVRFTVSAVEYLFSLDILTGDLISPAESFDYMLFGVAFKGSVVVGWFELRGARVLFANNMQPRLAADDRESHELRYYKWYSDNVTAVNVPDDRRLTSWAPEKDAWALGIGVNASLAALGKAVELSAFVLVVSGNDENGVLVVAEVLLAQSPKPIGFAAIQWDGKNDRFSMLVGVNLSPGNFLKSIPDWVDRIGRLTGTLFIGNKPATVAIGKLADTRTWLSLRFDIDLWVQTFIQFGFCFEYVEGGAKGVGLVVRLEGGINARIVRVTYNAGFGLLIVAFQTGSTDYAAAIWIEAGLRIVLFKFLRFGINARAEYRNVGARPSRGEMRVEIRLETPWFMPDVTWTFEITFGDLIPEDLATAVAPLRSASANEEGRQRIQAVHVERIDPSWNGEGVTPTFSIRDFRGMTLPEADRLARFEADTLVLPVATTSRIAIEWSVPVNDMLALDGNAAPNLGIQQSGDLTLVYEVIKLGIRRRSRFGLDRSWHVLSERIELGADFSDPSGVGLSGSFEPTELTTFWDSTVQIEGRTATKKLLINGKTPFEFQTRNPEIDEDVVRDNPSWPCCNPKDVRRQPKVHEVLFRTEPAGAEIRGDRLFTNSQSRLHFTQTAYVVPETFSATLPPNTLVGLVQPSSPGPLFRAALAEDAAFCMFRIFWRRSALDLVLIAFDDDGEEAGRVTVAPASDFQFVVLPARRPVRSIEARAVGRNPGLSARVAAATAPLSPTLLVDMTGYIGLRDYLDYLVGLESCDSTSPEFDDRFAGRGAVSFLPNHDYEIAIKTRLTISHPSKPAESAEVEEFVYFKTKGLPGLNAVGTIGEELAPLVTSAYAGGRGTLYREEPIAVAFTEDFHVVIPLAVRPAGTSQERTTLMRLQLVVRPDTAPTLDTPFTETTPDWIVAHRGIVVQEPRGPYKVFVSKAQTLGTAFVSTDPFRQRLATLTQRATATCDVGDPRNVVGTALVAPPQGTADPENPDGELWPASLPFTAIVKVEGAGFVDRRSFDPADKTALVLTLDNGAFDRDAWSVDTGRLTALDGPARRFAIFGDPEWNHLTTTVTFASGAPAAGIGVGLPAVNVPSRGLFAMVETGAAGRRLAIFRRTSGLDFTEEASAPLPSATDPAPTSLVVTAFDDRLRASVGDVVLEVDRAEQRDGRFCLVARGAAEFSSLQVSGVQMFKFPFQPGRFRSFTEHIESFDGTLDVIHADALGAGTTTASTASLFAAPDTAIGTVMQPDGDAAQRQIVFDRWVAALGLPLKDEVTELEISRFENGGTTELLLIESPEPLDFTREVTLDVSRRTFLPPRPPFGQPGGTVFDPGRRRTGAVSGFDRRRDIQRSAREELERLAQGSRPPGLVAGAPHHTEADGRFLRQAAVEDDGVLLAEIDPSDRRVRPGSRLVFAAASGQGADRRVRLYAASLSTDRRKGPQLVTARLTDEIAAGQQSSVMPPAIQQLESGAVAVLTEDLRDLLGVVFSPLPFTPVPTQILQDGSGRRALVIPVEGSSAKPFARGTYRLRLSLSRARWESTDPGDVLNRYESAASLQLVV